MINSIDLLIILCLGIYGIILLSGGIIVSNGEYNCNVEKSVSNSTITSIFLGTMLATLFLCFTSLGIFVKTKGINDKTVIFKSPVYISIAIVIITSIISISLGSVILNGIKDDEDEDEDEDEETKSCNLIKYGGNIILWTGIVLVIIISILGLIKLYQQYVKKNGMKTFNKNQQIGMKTFNKNQQIGMKTFNKTKPMLLF